MVVVVFSLSVELSGKSFVLIEKVNAPSFNVKSGITLDKNIISLPFAISKSADSINEDCGCPFSVNTPAGSLLYKLLPPTVAPVVIVFPNTVLSAKVVKILEPYVQ